MYTIIALITAAVFKAHMDYESETGGKGKSWRNKWKLKECGGLIEQTKAPWYYLWVYKPKYKERFPYSSTMLVRFTDKWHMYQSLMLTFTFIAMVTYKLHVHIVVDFCILYATYTLTFELYYRYRLKK